VRLALPIVDVAEAGDDQYAVGATGLLSLQLAQGGLGLVGQFVAGLFHRLPVGAPQGGVGSSASVASVIVRTSRFIPFQKLGGRRAAIGWARNSEQMVSEFVARHLSPM
jgi:hypothetical protein